MLQRAKLEADVEEGEDKCAKELKQVLCAVCRFVSNYNDSTYTSK